MNLPDKPTNTNKHAVEPVNKGTDPMPSTGAKGIEALLAEVNALSNQVRKGVDEGDSVRLGGRSILKILGEDGPLTVPEMARVRATSRQNIQILVNRLEADGCVDLVNNPAHQRSALVRITERGRGLLGTVREEEQRFLRKLLPHISEAELASATATLRRMRSLLAAGESASEGVRRERPASKLEAWRTRRVSAVPVAAPRTAAGAVATEDLLAKVESEGDFPVNLL